jgi:beta-1,2-mannosidase
LSARNGLIDRRWVNRTGEVICQRWADLSNLVSFPGWRWQGKSARRASAPRLNRRRRLQLRKPRRWALLLFLAPSLLAARTGTFPFGAWRRVSNTPILSPRGTTWESAGTFNPAVIRVNVSAEHRTSLDSSHTKIVMLYRAQDALGTSRLGYAESLDGIHFTRRAQPVLWPEAEYESGGGVEDPRLQKLGDTYYLTYTGYNKKDAQLCLATSADLIHWERKGVILPAYKGNWNAGWTKSGAIVPEKIDGKYWMYWLGTAADKTDQMGLSYSSDLIHWTEATDEPVLPRRPGGFDSRVVEPGPPPILTQDGIVLVYNGADDQLVYTTGIAVFDRRDPRKLVSRCDQPVFIPEKNWEKAGQVHNVVFVEGMIPVKTAEGNDRDAFRFYYGAADKYVGVAEGKLNFRAH